MPPKSKEPNRHQLSSRLSYSQNTPTFLLKLQNRINGVQDDDDDDPEFEPDDGSGRPPIPRRPAIPQRPDDDPGSAEEDGDEGDEKPQVVVLRAGKHLTEREAENVRRAERGLAPIVDTVVPEGTKEGEAVTKEALPAKSAQQGSSLSFSSSSKTHSFGGKKKRKAVGDLDPEEGETATKLSSSSSQKKKKVKKGTGTSKTLLSFGDDA